VKENENSCGKFNISANNIIGAEAAKAHVDPVHHMCA
jgi:hypothetical protein